ncbi:chitin deacetylase 1 isoform X2 [Temnothorax nylanderi]|uniref:chitin deacetylase 1 isoform X2 n=1 Tax=Temnothorax nylanderi TaxID=102681 RepID=UPI003A89D970
MWRRLRFVLITLLAVSANTAAEKGKSGEVPCIDDNKFYRNPNAPSHSVWSPTECAKYFLCLDDEVFEFKCSQGLLFDVSRQICDFKTNVDNCDVTSDAQPAKPLLKDGECDEDNLACGDGTCLPALYFCDGSVDCPDGSDEGWCDMRHDINAAPVCDTQKCQLPNCWCSKEGTQIPGNLTALATPQMITITFDDAVNAENFELYSKIFTDDRKNPNGCPIRGTFYISHQYTNYRDVQYLWNAGHEIAAHSVTHRGPEEWWSKNATIEDWFDEMVGIANIIKKYAAVRIADIKGVRAPFLQVGWNRQFLMMSEFGFVYDSSIVAPFSDPPFWPYTLDYRPPHPCVRAGQLCPTRSYPGIWELPLNQLLANDYTCSTVDSCPPDLSGEDVYKMLMLNFKRHYLTNRAPFGLHFHASWFQNPMYFYAFNKFIDDLLRLDDVFFVTSNQIVEWMRRPTPLSEIEKFAPWQCAKRHFEPYEMACDLPNSCKLSSKVLKSYRYLHTCFECPKQYPWLRNEFGIE